MAWIGRVTSAPLSPDRSSFERKGTIANAIAQGHLPTLTPFYAIVIMCHLLSS
jgi:hypothetical protein